jgi:hypothetical protein
MFGSKALSFIPGSHLARVAAEGRSSLFKVTFDGVFIPVWNLLSFFVQGAVTEYQRLVAYKQQAFISCRSGGWKCELRCSYGQVLGMKQVSKGKITCDETPFF